jgi:predicted nucleic acid-binding protein
MILADTCIWADHIDRGDAMLSELMVASEIVVHPFVVGEIFLGNLRNRAEWSALLSALPEFLPARNGEVIAMIEGRRLFGSGIGYVDAHLLAAVATLPGCFLWTRDRKLRRVAQSLGLDAGLD